MDTLTAMLQPLINRVSTLEDSVGKLDSQMASISEAAANTDVYIKDLKAQVNNQLKVSNKEQMDRVTEIDSKQQAQSNEISSMHDCISSLKRDVQALRSPPLSTPSPDAPPALTQILEKQVLISQEIVENQRKLIEAVSSTIASPTNVSLGPNNDGSLPIIKNRINVDEIQNIEQWKTDDNNVYVGRGGGRHKLECSIFCNPFTLAMAGGDRRKCVDMFKEFAESHPGIQSSLHLIRDKQLGCHCKDNEVCHADVLIKMAQSSHQPPISVEPQRQNNSEHAGFRHVQNNQYSRQEDRLILIVMDSNRNHINFRKLFEGYSVRMMKAGTVKEAREKFQLDGASFNPTDIVVHLGTNDVESEDAIAVANNIQSLSKDLKRRYHCNVHISPLPPRGDALNTKVITVNSNLRNNPEISQYARLINQPDLSVDLLYDKKHLATKQRGPGQLSGVQTLARNLFIGVTGKQASKTQLHNMQTWVNPVLLGSRYR